MTRTRIIILALLILLGFITGAALRAFGQNVTNTVLMVDQRGNLNVDGVASVEDVATNAAKAVVAEQKAETAQQTALAVSNSINTVVQNLGTTKPTVMHRATIDGARSNFAELPDSGVTVPVYHAEEREFGGQTFAGYYTVTATIANPSSATSYFLWVKCEADAPSGQGATLDLPNGVTGGVTEAVTWGNRTLLFVGGVLMGVE